MKNLLNEQVRGIEISGIRKFVSLLPPHERVVSLTLGQPDFPTPQHIKDAAKAAIDENRTVYTPNAGLPTLRQAAAVYFRKKYDLCYDPDTEILVTNGASEGIDSTLRTVLREGDEVLLPAPVYPGYEPLIRLMGCKPVYVDITQNAFKLSASLISEKLTPKTRCIILPSPSNPTGSVLSPADLEEIADLLWDKNLFVLSDEIYSELLYDDEHRSIATFKGMRERTIIINGLSKSHSMTGWRIGFVLAPEFIVKNIVKVHQYNSTCASSISQYAALEALENGFDDALPMKQEYRQRRDYVYQRLLKMGLETVKPSGAFYIFPSIAKAGLPSFEFCKKLLELHKVAIIPGDAFSSFGEGYIRISFASSMEQLTEGLDGLERFLASIQSQR